MAGNRRMRAAFQIGFAQAHFGEPGPQLLFDMARLAIVRGTGQGDMLGAESEALDGAAFDEGQRLDGLGCRARQDRRIDIAPGVDHGAVGLHDRGRALVTALDHRASCDFDDDRTLCSCFPFQQDDR